MRGITLLTNNVLICYVIVIVGGAILNLYMINVVL